MAIYKVDRSFAKITAARNANDLVMIIKAIGIKLGVNIGSYPGSPYTPGILGGYGTTLYNLYQTWFLDQTKENEDPLIAGMLLVVGYLRVMANFTDETAEGNKTLVELIGFGSVTGSSTALPKPTAAVNSLLSSIKSVIQKLLYSQKPKKDIYSTLVISSTIAGGLSVNATGDNQIEIDMPAAATGKIFLNLFTGSKGEIQLTGLSGQKLSSISFGVNPGGISPGVTQGPTTIP